MMCRHEWHDAVYVQSSTTLMPMITVPSPMPKPPSLPWKARIRSQVLISETTTAA